MLTDFPWPTLNEIDLADVYFQQDGAPSHTNCQTTALLCVQFERGLSHKIET